MGRVFLAYDRDKAGDEGAAAAAAQLAAHGVEALRVMFPPGMDANAYALAVQPADKALGVLLRAALPLGGRGTAPAPKMPAASSLHGGVVDPLIAAASSTVVPAPSSLAAKAASGAAPAAPAPEVADAPKQAAGEESLPRRPRAAPPWHREKRAGRNVLSVGDREYRMRGLMKNTGFESLRVTLRAACGERWHLDTLDLCSARQRRAFR